MSNIKTLHLITALNPGGAEMMVYKTVVNWGNSKFRNVVVSLLPEGPIGKKIEMAGVKVYYLNMTSPLGFLMAAYRLGKIIKKEKVDIIHSYMFHADILGRITGKLFGVRVIISSIRNENIGGRFREKILGMTDFMVDKVTAVCQAAGEKQLERGSFSKEKLEVIYNGVELGRFDHICKKRLYSLKKELGIPDDNHVFMTIGRLAAQKNHELLISSFVEVVETDPQNTLVIVGEGTLRSSLEDLVKSFGIEDHVVFTGVRDDIPQLLSLSDVFVLASSWEGMPNVALEAMAAKKPVIATAVGGTPEIVVDAKTGFLIPPDDKEALTNELKRFLELTEGERQGLGLNGRKRIEESFTIERTIKATEALYISLLQSKDVL